MERYRFDVYGRLRLEVVRDAERWRVYRLGEGTRREDPDLRLRPDVPGPELQDALEVLLHELGDPGRHIRPLP